METELDGRLLALRQAVALALALATRSNPQATELALEILNDMKTSMDSTRADAPFAAPAWAQGAQDELNSIARLVSAFTQPPTAEPGS